MKSFFAVYLFLISNLTSGQDSSDLLDKSWEAEAPIKISEEQTLQAFQLTLYEDVNFKENVIFQEAVISEKIIDGVHQATSASFSGSQVIQFTSMLIWIIGVFRKVI